jgi:IS30 family transposase
MPAKAPRSSKASIFCRIGFISRCKTARISVPSRRRPHRSNSFRVGRGHRGGLVTLVERKSGYTLLARVDDRRTATVCCAAEQRLAVLPPHLRRTLTFDNGKEFAEHEALAVASARQVSAPP